MPSSIRALACSRTRRRRRRRARPRRAPRGPPVGLGDAAGVQGAGERGRGAEGAGERDLVVGDRRGLLEARPACASARASVGRQRCGPGSSGPARCGASPPRARRRRRRRSPPPRAAAGRRGTAIEDEARLVRPRRARSARRRALRSASAPSASARQASRSASARRPTRSASSAVSTAQASAIGTEAERSLPRPRRRDRSGSACAARSASAGRGERAAGEHGAQVRGHRAGLQPAHALSPSSRLSAALSRIGSATEAPKIALVLAAGASPARRAAAASPVRRASWASTFERGAIRATVRCRRTARSGRGAAIAAQCQSSASAVSAIERSGVEHSGAGVEQRADRRRTGASASAARRAA